MEQVEPYGKLGATKDNQLGEENASDGHQVLPMVVWLAGDEAHADDFCIDADTAMQELGIKRSRLTQISGRELRVVALGSIAMFGRFTGPSISQSINSGPGLRLQNKGALSFCLRLLPRWVSSPHR